jgi:hypothetical protein
MKKGQKMSDELKEKIRQSNIGRKHNLSEAGRSKLSSLSCGGWNKNLKCSEEWVEKVRKARLGTTHTEDTKVKMKLSAKIGETNNKWTGDNVGYRALHYWIERNLGKSNVCEHCGVKGKMHRANKSHKYLRDTSDWIRLCPKCHKKYDKEFTTR